MKPRRVSSPTPPRPPWRWLVVSAALAFCLGPPSNAFAFDRRIEASAKQALLEAANSHVAKDDESALLTLEVALHSCGTSRCAPATRAALFRDIGAIQFARHERSKATVAFNEAVDLVEALPWNATYDDPDVVAEWSAVKNERAALRETPPGGDLEHVPEREQAVGTPLPIYVETSEPGVAKVVVKYKVPGESEFKRRTLPRFGGGWGGTIPCADVKRGLLRYFLQAFDADGNPIGNSGDVRHMYFVPVRWSLVGEPPHLPGHAPPEPCAGATPTEDEPAVAGPEAPTAATNEARFVRFWFGVSGSIDLTTLPSGTDVCALSSALTPAQSGFYCTNPNGTDFPTRSATASPPTVGKSGDSSGGPASGDVRILLTADYATSSHFLTGVRGGYVAQSYPGAAAGKDGHGLTAPVHLEARETYLFGHAPLAHSGFAPYVYLAAGYAKFDASAVSTEQTAGVVGPRPVLVWRLGGPWFVASGAGARYAFSPRVAFLAGIKAALPFGSGGFLPSIAPEGSLQYGF